MRLLVTGREGQVARAIFARGARHPGIEVVAVGRPELDLERPQTVKTVIAALRPDIVVNAAAYTAVDKAEQDAPRAFAVNCDGAAAVAEAAAALGIPLIHLSTDYVYDGAKPVPYMEGDPVAPLGVYGSSKLAGEQAVAAVHASALILRTAWVYSPFGSNFVKTMLRLGRERDVLRVVDDQTGNPTSALDIADAILRIAPALQSSVAAGAILHLAGTGTATWYGLACHVFACARNHGGPQPEVQPIVSAEYPTPAKRPAKSRLDCSAFERQFGFVLPHWQSSVGNVIKLLFG
jgi:dTDP-4-dehydrorhamnose reductase